VLVESEEQRKIHCEQIADDVGQCHEIPHVQEGDFKPSQEDNLSID